MEETNANVQLKLNELQHCFSTPNQSVKKEIKNVSITAEEITDNPEYLVMRRSVAVQTVTNEEVVIPKLDPALNQRSNFLVASPEDGTMEMDISSQESVMDIASQESLSVKDSNPEEPLGCNHSVSVALREKAVRRREENVQKREEDVQKRAEAALTLEEDVREREEAVLKREGNAQKREESVLAREEAAQRNEEAMLECKDRLNIFKEGIVNQERILFHMKMEMQEFQKILNAQPRYCNHTVSVSAYGDTELPRGEDVRKREEAVLKREVGKRQETMLECKGRGRIFNNDVTNRERILFQMKTEIEENRDILDIQDQQIADRELTLQKLDVAVKIRELEAKGFKIIPPRSENNEDDCLPAKRAKKC